MLSQGIVFEMAGQKRVQFDPEGAQFDGFARQCRDQLCDRAPRGFDSFPVVRRAECGKGHDVAIKRDGRDGFTEPRADDPGRAPHCEGGAAPVGGGKCLPTSATICPTMGSGGQVENAMVPPRLSTRSISAIARSGRGCARDTGRSGCRVATHACLASGWHRAQLALRQLTFTTESFSLTGSDRCALPDPVMVMSDAAARLSTFRLPPAMHSSK